MKNLSIYLFILLSLLTSCKEDKDDYVIYECAGSSTYYIDNQSSQSFTAKFSGTLLSEQLDTATVIQPKQRIKLGQDGQFGYIPKPADTFSKFALYKIVEGNQQVLYAQEPVDNSLWVKRKFNESDPDYGCYSVDYTLTVTDDMLK